MTEKLFIKELSVRNFRSLKKFDTSGNFGQINLITGKNNSGKTSLLEALFLNLGPTNPELWINISGRRGLIIRALGPTTASYLFHQKNTLDPIHFEIETLNHSSSKLQIKHIEPTTYEIPDLSSETEERALSSIPAITDKEVATGLELTFTLKDREPIVTRAVISNNRLNIERNGEDIYPESVYVSAGNVPNPREESKRYDQLNRVNSVPKFERALRLIEPNLVRTSLAIENNETIIHGDVGYGLVPLALLGSGSKRLTSILLGLTYSDKGVVLIDEIENSFHYSVLEGLWTSIAEFTENYSGQIFVATHSKECTEAALKIFSKKKQHLDFRLHRLDRKIDKTEIFTFDKNQLEAALETGWEVR